MKKLKPRYSSESRTNRKLGWTVKLTGHAGDYTPSWNNCSNRCGVPSQSLVATM